MLNAFLPYLRNSSWLLGVMKLGAGFHLSKSAEERRLLRKCFLSFSGISDATETCWHAAVMIATLLDFFKKGKHRVLRLTPGVFAHLHLNHVVKFRQALWSCWELLSPADFSLFPFHTFPHLLLNSCSEAAFHSACWQTFEESASEWLASSCCYGSPENTNTNSKKN